MKHRIVQSLLSAALVLAPAAASALDPIGIPIGTCNAPTTFFQTSATRSVEDVCIPISAGLLAGSRVHAVHHYNKNGTQNVAVVLVPGLAHASSFGKALASNLIDERGFKDVFVIDPPGHGPTSVLATDVTSYLTATGKKYGELALEDYAKVVTATSKLLADDSHFAQRSFILAGHSMGGIVVTMAANAWMSSDLAKVDGYVLLNPTLPEGISWGYADRTAALLKMMVPFLVPSAKYGTYMSAPNPDFLKLFYTTSAGENVFPASESAPAWNDEDAYTAVVGMVGLDLKTGNALRRPLIDQGLFQGVPFALYSTENDSFMTPKEERYMYYYATCASCSDFDLDEAVTEPAPANLVEDTDAEVNVSASGVSDAVHCLAGIDPRGAAAAFDAVLDQL